MTGLQHAATTVEPGGVRGRPIAGGLVVGALTALAALWLAATVLGAGLSAGVPVGEITLAFHSSAHATVVSTAVGSTIHPSVAIAPSSGGTPTGTVVIRRFANSTCTGTAAATSAAMALGPSGGVDGVGFTFSSTTAGTWWYAASYSGNASYDPKVSACRSIMFTKILPTLRLRAHDDFHVAVTSIGPGSSIHGFATIAGTLGTPTGGLSFSRFSSSNCAGAANTIHTTQFSNGAAEGTPTGPLTATISLRVSYFGDATYAPLVTPCLNVPVEKLAPNLTLALHDFVHSSATTRPAGSFVHLAASVGGSNGTPTGTVTYRRHSGGDCKQLNLAETNLTLSSGHADSASWTLTDPGSFSLQARYNGDTVYAAKVACLNYTVTKGTPTVAFAAHTANHSVVVSVRAGTSIHFAATVTGSAGMPTGQVRFTLYENPDCTGAGTFSGAPHLDATGKGESSPFGIPAPHVYGVRAAYLGDLRYNPKDSPCQVLTITKALVASQVFLHGPLHQIITQPRVGEVFHAQVWLSGPVGVPTGAAKWQVWAGAECTGTPAQTWDGPLTNGMFDPPAGYAHPQAGTVAYRHSYGGNAVYDAWTGACSHAIVVKSNPSVDVKLHNDSHQVVTTAPAMTRLHARSEVGGPFGTATGTTSFSIYQDAGCSAFLFGHPPLTLVSGAGHSASSFSLGAPGTYYYRVSYSGDPTYNTGTSACKPLVVTKATPTMRVAVHDAAHAVVTTGPVGVAVHARVDMDGVPGPTTPVPGGTVTGGLYLNGTCSGSPTASYPATSLTTGGAEMPPVTPMVGGALSFRFSYSGNAVYLPIVGPCTSFTVTKVAAAVTSFVHDGAHQSTSSVPVGTLVHARGTVSGVAGSGTGTVVFRWFTGNACGGSQIREQGGTLVSGSLEASAVTEPVAVVRSVRAHYSGNASYTAGTGNCVAVTFTRIASALLMEIHSPTHQVVTAVPVGTNVHPSVVVSGALSLPAGTVSFQWFANPNCSSPAHSTSAPLTLVGGALDATGFVVGSAAPIAASGRATWSGDATYLPATSACMPVTFNNKLPSTLSLTVHDPDHDAVTSVPEGTPVHPRASVAGSGPAPTGNVTFNWFAGPDCATPPLATSAATPLVGAALDATAFAQAPVSAGAYAFRAAYGGDAQYNGSVSACVSLSVAFVGPAVVSFEPAAAVTGATSLAWSLVFDQPVSGLASADLAIGGTSTGWAVASVQGSGAAWSVVTTAANPGAGALVLTLAADSVNGADAAGPNEPVVSEPAIILPFSDITGSIFRDDIVWLAGEGITTGCGPRLFCPLATVTRAQMASFLARALELPDTGTDYFTDDEGNTHEVNINRLAAAGITLGCGPNLYCPNAGVTRAEMASFLARALGLVDGGDIDYFTDDDGNSHETNINRLRHAGITTGCTATTFCPSELVTRGQMAAFLRRAFE